MADIEYDYGAAPYSEPAQGDPSAFGVILNWVGALMSVGLVVGLAVWAWQLTVRDVSGVPVIRALEGPMRVAPEDPGGTIAENQGLAVNRITEGAEAAPAAERIVLAPEPLDLEEIDLSSASLPEDAIQPAEATGEETLALIDRLLEEAVPLDPLPDSPNAAAQPERPLIEVISSTIPGVSRSVRPAVRPSDLQVASLAPVALPSASGDIATQEIAADALAQGTRLVQLGAFDDAETAREEWARLARAFPDFFRDKDRVVQEAVSGGREFFRLRAHGFTDLSDARRFCTALNAQGAACIPVTLR